MSPNSDSGATELLRAWSQGDGSALDRLVPLVYQELHRLARRYMRQERPDHTLQATSLVNEAYLRLIDVNRIEWRDRAHFLAVAAQMMRRILVEFARNRQRQKRGGGAVHVSLDDVQELPDSKDCDVVASGSISRDDYGLDGWQFALMDRVRFNLRVRLVEAMP